MLVSSKQLAGGHSVFFFFFFIPHSIACTPPKVGIVMGLGGGERGREGEDRGAYDGNCG